MPELNRPRRVKLAGWRGIAGNEPDPNSNFIGCWRRIERASAHRSEMMRLWEEFMDEEPYEASLRGDDNGVFRLIFDPEPLPVEMSLLLGEFLYQLRACLDHVVYVTAIAESGQNPPPSPRLLEFPICETETSWASSSRKIAPLSAAHQSIIESVQPYRYDNPKDNALYWLNDLARIDRHRLPHLTAIRPVGVNPLVKTGRDGATVDFLDEDPLPGDVEMIANFVVTPYQTGDDVLANPNGELLLELPEMAQRAAETEFIRDHELGDRLFNMEESIECVVARIERSLEDRTAEPWQTLLDGAEAGAGN